MNHRAQRQGEQFERRPFSCGPEGFILLFHTPPLRPRNIQQRGIMNGDSAWVGGDRAGWEGKGHVCRADSGAGCRNSAR